MPATQSPSIELVKLAAFSAALVPVSIAVLWQAVHLSRRRRNIVEY